MKTSPEYDRFKTVLNQILSVSRSEIQKREAAYQKMRAGKKKTGPKKK